MFGFSIIPFAKVILRPVRRLLCPFLHNPHFSLPHILTSAVFAGAYEFVRARSLFRFGGCLLLCRKRFLVRHGIFDFLVISRTVLPILSKIG